MDEQPAFFLPLITPDDPETVYARLAEMCKCPIPKQEEQVYSITFVHNGEEWTATVGEYLHGVRRRTSRSKGKKVAQKISLSDRARVLAIFPNEPYVVVTNKGIPEDIRSSWANPFYVGNLLSVLHFKV